MKIKELENVVNILSKEFIKLEEIQVNNIYFVKKKQEQIEKLMMNLEKHDKELLNGIREVKELRKSLFWSKLLNYIWIGTLVISICSFFYFSFEIKGMKQENQEKNNEIVRTLLGDRKFWYDSESENIYWNEKEEIDKNKNK